MLLSLLGSIIGGAGAIGQKVLENKQEIRLAEINLQARERASQDSLRVAEVELDKDELNAEAEYYKAIADTSFIREEGEYLLTRIQNFIINTARPILTYILLGCAFVCAFIVITSDNIKQEQKEIIEYIFFLLDTVLAYWFMRRSMEKTSNVFSNSIVKKNSEIPIRTAQTQTLKVNFTAKELIKKYEGCELKAYKCSGGKWTIGYGNTSLLRDKSDAECKNYTITQAQAEELFEEDYNHHRELLEKVIIHILDTLTENQIGALTSFVFNFGIGAFEKSTLLKVIRKNPNNRNAIEKEFRKWVYAGGKKLDGLIKRRRDEVALYFS